MTTHVLSRFLRVSMLCAAALLSLAILPFTTGIAHAAVRLVSTTGTDNTDCLTPCRHIQYAISKAAPGDTVLVAAGTYTENVQFGGGVHLVSNEGATIQGDGTRQAVDISGGGPTSILEGFVITGGNIGIVVFEASVEIRRNVIVNNLLGSQGGGIFLQTCSAVIANNLIRGNTTSADGGAIEVESCTGPVSIINNTIDSNSSSNSLSIGQAIGIINSSSVLIQNNIISNHNAFAKAAVGVSGTAPVVRNNLFFNNAILYYDSGTVSTIAGLNALASNGGNIAGDPAYVNTGSGNFHLQNTSPAINAGLLSGAPSVDFDGDPRPQGGAVDIGFDETSVGGGGGGGGGGGTVAVAGCVQIQGAPLVGASVKLLQEKSAKKAILTTTDTNGCYSFGTAVSGRTGTLTIELPQLP